MAHFRCRRSRLSTTHTGYSHRSQPGYWMNSWPAWWDLVFHRRPPRRRTKRLEQAVMQGRDPDDIAWPVAKKPHNYFW